MSIPTDKLDRLANFGSRAAQQQEKRAADSKPVTTIIRNVQFRPAEQVLIKELLAKLREAGEEYPTLSNAVKVALRLAAPLSVSAVRTAMDDVTASDRRRKGSREKPAQE